MRDLAGYVDLLQNLVHQHFPNKQIFVEHLHCKSVVCLLALHLENLSLGSLPKEL